MHICLGPGNLGNKMIAINVVIRYNHVLLIAKKRSDSMALTIRLNQDQENTIERLKLLFDVGTSSKALLVCAEAYLVQREILKKVSRSYSFLESKFNKLVDLNLQKLEICNQLDEIRDQGLSNFDVGIPVELDEPLKVILESNLNQHGMYYS